ncbi:MAG: superoxide dismutase [Lachnospiraceae bacterium]|nr:superoxide dismutase [Lachnospiraceae bacterium]
MFEQVKLAYAVDALEPHIDKETVETHHGKHHATYTTNLNNFAEKAGVADMDIEELLASLDTIEDPALRTAIRNNGGGFYNHNLYFSTISPNGGGEPEGKLLAKINETFGSFAQLKEKLTALAIGQFGSGWAWLETDADGTLSVSNSLNQDNPISLGTGKKPIVAIDVWEHAYYLKYKNLRAEYIKELFELIDWKLVAEKYEAITTA